MSEIIAHLIRHAVLHIAQEGVKEYSKWRAETQRRKEEAARMEEEAAIRRGIKKITAPTFDDGSTEAVVRNLYKNEGDIVKKGEKLMQVRTSKGHYETWYGPSCLEASGGGIIRVIAKHTGDTVTVGEILLFYTNAASIKENPGEAIITSLLKDVGEQVKPGDKVAIVRTTQGEKITQIATDELGIIKSIPKRVGDTVKQGDVMLYFK
jgi:pyruvate/2-oxoglutarate dehydrogenase complex dihydrolipoamide acyltransferase (E2) component